MEQSDAYRALREELRQQEIALKEQRERVAELRRRLPLDTVIEDHHVTEAADGSTREVRLSELFTDRDLPLVLVHFMFGKKQREPCPMCMGAILWARINRVHQACDRTDAEAAGFDDARFHAAVGGEGALEVVEDGREEGLGVFDAWRAHAGRTPY